MTKSMEDLIESVFVAPIRSVVIVDDDYPTIEDTITDALSSATGQKPPSSGKQWRNNPEAVQKVISEFRNEEKKYILDIHDAQTLTDKDEIAGAAHLHQTDLLVLDCELDRSKGGDFSKSVSIAKTLFDSDHFNLIVVNTNKDLNEIFEHFFLALRLPCLPDLTEGEHNCLDEVYSNCENLSQYSERMKNSFGFTQYAAAVSDPKFTRKLAHGSGEFARCAALLSEAKIHQKYWSSLSKQWLKEYEVAVHKAGRFGKTDLYVSEFNFCQKTKWIRSSRAFMTFSAKADDTPLLDVLRVALNDWQPKPSRLLLTRMSVDIERRGTEMQDASLFDDASAGLWFYELLRATDNTLKHKVDQTAWRHIEGMISQIIPGVRDFATDLIKCLKGANSDEDIQSVKKYYKIDLGNKVQKETAALNHNVIVCCEPISGWHLTTGQIFKIGEVYWVCATPLCDMVPEQISKNAAQMHGERIRFSAIRLFPESTGALAKVHSNRYVFIKNGNDVQPFSASADENAMPEVGIFFAENKGIFASDYCVKVWRAENGEDELLKMVSYDVQISHQLRVEYAHNFVQKLSISQSRMGLDYVN